MAPILSAGFGHVAAQDPPAGRSEESAEKASSPEAQIQALIDRETRAWNQEDVELLLSIFHPDMVWPWPPNPQAHDPEDWELVLGRFDHDRWTAVYRDLFERYDLVHNRRKTVKITLSDQGDGAFAVVDIDTLWRDEAGETLHWKGRVGKGYTLVNGEWKLILHTGALDYQGRDR